MIAAAVANGGVMMEPYVLDHVENENGRRDPQFFSENLADSDDEG